MRLDTSLGGSALNDHSLPPVWILLATAFTHNSQRLCGRNSAHSHRPDAVKLNFPGTFALFDGKVNPLPVRNTRIYDFKMCVQLLLCDEFL